MNTKMSEGGSGGTDLSEEVTILNETITILESDLKTSQEKTEELTKEI